MSLRSDYIVWGTGVCPDQIGNYKNHPFAEKRKKSNPCVFFIVTETVCGITNDSHAIKEWAFDNGEIRRTCVACRVLQSTFTENRDFACAWIAFRVAGLSG